MQKIDRGFRNRLLMGSIPVLMLFLLSFNAEAEWVSIVPPEVSADWGLNKVRVLSSGNGWAVGVDVANQQGAILQFKDHAWIAFDPPKVSSNWELNSLYFTKASDVWAVGVDFSTGSRSGVILHYTNGLWNIITPPRVSRDWGLYDVAFVSSKEGWAVGVDYSNLRGVLLHYASGVWSSYAPPDLGLDWGLYGIHMITAKEGWAVGVDSTNRRGALLQYTKDPQDTTKKGSTAKKRYIWQMVLPPQIDADWELSSVHFTSETEGWAAGVNRTQQRGALLHFYNTVWAEVIPPAVSPDWEFDGIYFSGVKAGWASGADDLNKKGLIIQFDKGFWTISSLPEVSSDWELEGVHFVSKDDGWAVGTDHENKRGVILRFSSSTDETISTPTMPNGPTNIAPGVPSTFFTGGSFSSLDHSLQYFFDWGDGTNSGWLPVGTLEASKTWDSAGTYLVKAQARCASDTSVVSKLSSDRPVTVSNTPTPVTLLSPSDGTFYTGCSLYSLPTFTWNATGSFTAYQLQFSTTESFDQILKLVRPSSTSMTIDFNSWKQIVAANGSQGGPIFWRVLATRSDNVAFFSETFSILIGPAMAVGNLTITGTSRASLPVLTWENNCNVTFQVRFGNDPNFTKKVSFPFDVKNPNDNGGEFTKSLNSSGWKSIQELVGKVIGAPIYYYVESWDGANRRAITQPVMSFILTD